MAEEQTRGFHALSARAFGAAATTRDGLRAAQYYARGLASFSAPGAVAAGSASPHARRGWIARLARMADRGISHSADLTIRLTVPRWRALPSPFEPNMSQAIATALADTGFLHTSLFTTYFYRAARHILERLTEGSSLILEHRIDKARERLLLEPASTGTELFLARALMVLVEAAPVVRAGTPGAGVAVFGGVSANVAVFSIATTALLLAEDGKPSASFNEDEFFAMVGALAGPDLPAIALAIARSDSDELAKVLARIKSAW